MSDAASKAQSSSTNPNGALPVKQKRRRANRLTPKQRGTTISTKEAMFQMYLSLEGERGAVKAITDAFHVDRKTVCTAKKVGKWDERLNDIRSKSDNLLNRQIAQQRINEVAVIDAIIAEVLVKLRTQGIDPTLDNLQKLINARQGLVPGTTEIPGGSGSGDVHVHTYLNVVNGFKPEEKSALDEDLGAIFSGRSARNRFSEN